MIVLKVLISVYPSNLNITCVLRQTTLKTIIITTTLLFIILVIFRFEGRSRTSPLVCYIFRTLRKRVLDFLHLPSLTPYGRAENYEDLLFCPLYLKFLPIVFTKVLAKFFVGNSYLVLTILFSYSTTM